MNNGPTKHVLFQGSILLVLFFTTWWLLSQVHWIQVLHVQELSKKSEEKLAELILSSIKSQGGQVNDTAATTALDSIVGSLYQTNHLRGKKITVHLLKNDEVNAFALPAAHLVIYTGLIDSVRQEEELDGIIGHELAHIQLDHVMKKLGKEIGISVLAAMAGGRGTEAITKAAKIVSSTAFDRTMEKAADLKAIEYLTKAHVDPLPFANFMDRLSKSEPGMINYLNWISTHPESKDRATYIRKRSQQYTFDHHKLLAKQTWDYLKNAVK